MRKKENWKAFSKEFNCFTSIIIFSSHSMSSIRRHKTSTFVRCSSTWSFFKSQHWTYCPWPLRSFPDNNIYLFSIIYFIVIDLLIYFHVGKERVIAADHSFNPIFHSTHFQLSSSLSCKTYSITYIRTHTLTILRYASFVFPSIARTTNFFIRRVRCTYIEAWSTSIASSSLQSITPK